MGDVSPSSSMRGDRLLFIPFFICAGVPGRLRAFRYDGVHCAAPTGRQERVTGSGTCGENFRAVGVVSSPRTSSISGWVQYAMADCLALSKEKARVVLRPHTQHKEESDHSPPEAKAAHCFLCWRGPACCLFSDTVVTSMSRCPGLQATISLRQQKATPRPPQHVYPNGIGISVLTSCRAQQRCYRRALSALTRAARPVGLTPPFRRIL